MPTTNIEDRTYELFDLTNQIEKANNQLLDTELEIEVAQAEQNGHTYKLLQQKHKAFLAEAKRLQFRFDRLYAEWSILIQLDQVRAIRDQGPTAAWFEQLGTEA